VPAMSPKQWVWVGGSVALVAWGGHTVVGCVGSEPVPSTDAATKPTPPVEGGPPGSKPNGQACAAPTDCQSSQCVDGVCCASACSGKCEACNLPGKAGTCEPVPDGEDPANDCPTTPLPPVDAGVVDDDAGADAAGAINVPEAGVTTDDTKCAGKCDGKRACAFPASKRRCGTSFCNSPTEEGRAACDGAGHCLLGLEACDAYSCTPGDPTCKTTCTSPSDCLPTHYCAGTGCKPRLGNGTVCQAGPQCTSGYCVGNVCCDDACAVTGGSCSAPGSVGKCVCPACPSGGACTLWYRDKDNDGFGDKDGTVLNGNAAPGCIAGPAPVPGFVKDNTDCDDNSANVKPGQTAYFTTPRANGSFDYDCSGSVEKEGSTYVGGSCGYCAIDRGVCALKTACSTARSQAYHGCINFSLFGAPSCKSTSQGAFHSTVACGATGTYYTCGSCSAAGGTASFTTAAKAQGCH